MKIYELLNKASFILLKKNKNRKSAYKECELILLSIINKSKDYLYRNFNNIVDEKIVNEFFQKIKKRLKGYPLQYITKYEIFCCRKFFVQKGVFIPRPDSEALIEAIKKINIKKQSDCIDIGCGTGCLGITAKLDNPFIKNITFIDNSKFAINITKKNLKLYNINAKIIYNSFFKYILINKIKYHVAICNPPYISFKTYKTLQKEVKFEPKNALFAAKDGYNFYIKLSSLGAKFLELDGYLVLEAGDNMADNIKKIFSIQWKYLFSVKDFNNIERALVFQLKY